MYRRAWMLMVQHLLEGCKTSKTKAYKTILIIIVNNYCQYDMHKPRPSSSTLSIIRAVLYNISLTAS